jgi:integrase
MGLIKNRHGVYNARKKVPPKLQEAVATVLGKSKHRQTWLKKSLGTKDIREANVRAKPVLMNFDTILARAEGLLVNRPMRTSLTASEIERMADYHFAHMLAAFDEFVQTAPLEEREFRALMEAKDGEQDWIEEVPEFGFSGGQMADAAENLPPVVAAAEAALARGSIQHVAHHTEEVLQIFRIRVDTKGDAYKALGMAVLRANVRALRASVQRTKGEPIETPQLVGPDPIGEAKGETLTGAFEGWQKARTPAAATIAEYKRAIDLFIELHGDLPIANIGKRHAREFRQALQEVPRQRTGEMQRMPLPELAKWGQEHPHVQKISPGTVNKQLGAVQAIAVWGHDNGSVPDDVAWTDPFARMRLEEPPSERQPFDVTDLQALFNSSVFTKGERPEPGQGETAYWLPLLALFTGGRRGELAGLSALDVQQEKSTRAHFLYITEDKKRGRTLKTKPSQRAIPVHHELIKLGFLKFVAGSRTRGEHAWLFPAVAPGTGGALKAWTKWFRRYLDEQGLADPNKVLHSFRHAFLDALRATNASTEIVKALFGHGDGSVSGRYGAKEMLRRFGPKSLRNAIVKLEYPGLDLSRVHPVAKRQIKSDG